jgi:hypothetical protein
LRGHPGADEIRNRDGRQHADDRDHDHDLNEGESRFASSFSFHGIYFANRKNRVNCSVTRPALQIGKSQIAQAMPTVGLTAYLLDKSGFPLAKKDVLGLGRDRIEIVQELIPIDS